MLCVMHDRDFDSELDEITADEYDPAAEDNEAEDNEAEVYPAARYQRVCALCNCCLSCGDATVDCICAYRSGNIELNFKIYKDVAVHGTSIAAFLQYRNVPLPNLPPGHYLPKVKLCSSKSKGCHKKYSNWKETGLGKASEHSHFPAASSRPDLPITPQSQTHKKPVQSQQAPKKVKVANYAAKLVLNPKGDAENDPPLKETVENDALLKETTDTKKQKTGVSTAIETVKIVPPDVGSLVDMWAYLESNLEAWEPASWDRSKLHYTEVNIYGLYQHQI
ncbi:hypothetical protein HDU80_011497 [Chytriomyces hyalinus]|nr:hypothetical protein HDU80_011497 [Chytriomyces hyalinus]